MLSSLSPQASSNAELEMHRELAGQDLLQRHVPAILLREQLGELLYGRLAIVEGEIALRRDAHMGCAVLA